MRGLFALGLALALAAGSLQAQSLGEAAAREKKRREEEQKKRKGPARVVTTEDLASAQGATATGPATPVAAQDLGGKPRSDATSADEPDPVGRPRVKETSPDAAPEVGGQDEKGWRSQAAENRKEILDAQQKIKGLEEQVSRLFGEIQRSTDSNEILRLRAQQDGLGEQIKIAKQELANLLAEQREFEDSARRAGVPPGWIR